MEKSSNSSIIEIVELIRESPEEIDDSLLICAMVPRDICSGMLCSECIVCNLNKLKSLEI